MSAWLRTRGMDPVAIKRRAIGGVILGLTVVAVDHVLRMGS